MGKQCFFSVIDIQNCIYNLEDIIDLEYLSMGGIWRIIFLVVICLQVVLDLKCIELIQSKEGF